MNEESKGFPSSRLMTHASRIAAHGSRIQRESLPGRPLVSIITVVLNGALHLEQAICSVLGQSYDNVEYIVVDGGSVDGTLDIIRRYEDCIDYWLSEPDSGIYDAMNKGIGLARGELIGILNSDDFYGPDALTSVIEIYQRQEGPQILFGHTLVSLESLGLTYRSQGRPGFHQGMGFYHPAMFVHRDIYGELGGYDLQYRLAADHEFVLRAIGNGVPFTPVDAFLVTYRGEGASEMNRSGTLAEIRGISRKYRGIMNISHLLLLLVQVRSWFAGRLGEMVRVLLGSHTKNRLRCLYLKKFIAGSAGISR